MLALSLIAERENESVPITHSCIDKRPQVAHAPPLLLCPASLITHSCIDKRPQVTLIHRGFSSNSLEAPNRMTGVHLVDLNCPSCGAVLSLFGDLFKEKREKEKQRK